MAPKPRHVADMMRQELKGYVMIRRVSYVWLMGVYFITQCVLDKFYEQAT